jgi:hypothetical protein
MRKHFFQLYKFIFILILGFSAGCSPDSDSLPDGSMLARDLLNESYGIDTRQILDVFFQLTDQLKPLLYCFIFTVEDG